MTTNYPLTIEEFRNWLKSKEENEVVGLSTTCTNCPIVNALKQGQYKFEDVYLNVDYGENREGETKLDSWMTFENPDWVNLFVDRIDHLGKTPEITAKLALQVLSEVEQECT